MGAEHGATGQGRTPKRHQRSRRCAHRSGLEALGGAKAYVLERDGCTVLLPVSFELDLATASVSVLADPDAAPVDPRWDACTVLAEVLEPMSTGPSWWERPERLTDRDRRRNASPELRAGGCLRHLLAPWAQLALRGPARPPSPSEGTRLRTVDGAGRVRAGSARRADTERRGGAATVVLRAGRTGRPVSWRVRLRRGRVRRAGLRALPRSAGAGRRHGGHQRRPRPVRCVG